MSMLVPSNILEDFEMWDAQESKERWVIEMREKEERIPNELSEYEDVVFDGYCNPIEMLSHSFVCKPIYLRLYRRRYKRANTDIHYYNEYDLSLKGVKMVPELGDEDIGGNVFQIVTAPRPLFYANAGNDIYVLCGEPVTLRATDIGEPAKYNWYDKYGNFCLEGIEYGTIITEDQNYKLEVIAEADGYKDYAEVAVKIISGKIGELFPNPATNIVTVSCVFNAAEIPNNTYIRISNTQGIIYGTHILNTMNFQNVFFYVSSYPIGTYVVTLVCNGEITDSKTFVKE